MPIVNNLNLKENQKKSFCYSFLKTNKRYEILNKSAPSVIIIPPYGQCWILNKPPIIHIESDKFFNLSAIILNVKFTLNIQKIYLTYLRGLEIAELKEEDMPMV